MIHKICGVILVVISCGSVGFRIAANHRTEERILRELIGILDYIECEIQFHLTPLPNLCRQVAEEFKDPLGSVFRVLSSEIDNQVSPDIAHCMSVTLKKFKSLPAISRSGLLLLGRSIGRFDLQGQLMGLESVRQECRRNLKALDFNRDSRLRSYQTLGICAGAALAILFV
jgi:stage III sporulation protein AB